MNATGNNRVNCAISVPLEDCARHLNRLWPSYGVTVRREISNLIEQCGNYERGNKYLARRMIETIERIEGERGMNHDTA